MIKVSPSILAADPLNMERDVQRMVDAGCDLLHVDIMDAHFVPNLSYGPALVEALHSRFTIPLDVHLMMENPEKYIETFAKAGAWGITIHAEIPGDVPAMLRQIRDLGLNVGLSVKPGTPVESIRSLLPAVDMVLIMTVEPGFGGQKFQSAMLEKIRELRAWGYTGLIEADGGVSLSNLPDLKAAGLDVAVMGTAMYRSADPAKDMQTIHAM
ncbi:MAG: ribulose-phosphate 3-epimerase [Clostridiales bacterium]|nr:ribulose-phosphate 3-epimerase [Clostridiales bacterium]